MKKEQKEQKDSRTRTKGGAAQRKHPTLGSRATASIVPMSANYSDKVAATMTAKLQQAMKDREDLKTLLAPKTKAQRAERLAREAQYEQ